MLFVSGPIECFMPINQSAFFKKAIYIYNMYKEKHTSLQPLSTSYPRGNGRERIRKQTREQTPTQLIDQHPGERPQEVRPTWIEVNLCAIEHNCRLIASLVRPGVSILACVKANAYGHGAIPVARTVLQHGADRLGVAMVSEARELRQAGIAAPLHILGETPSWQMQEAVSLDLTLTLCNLEAARKLALISQAAGKLINVHIKVDTGMGRLGISAEHLTEIIALIGAL
jgi:alanine racemase